MKILVTGATGFIGSKLAIRLADSGHIVHALYRSESKTYPLKHHNIVLFKGDILDYNSLEKAMENCDQVYHTAAFTKVWTPDPALIYRLNIEGTLNILKCGITQGITKFVCTSTAGVIGPSEDGKSRDEFSSPPSSFFTGYESSKAILESIIKTLCSSGVHIVIVNPTRVYGPGLLSESNSVTRMIIKYTRGRWRFIPGNGESSGNYVYIEDVVNGHILAMEKGIPGERYILGGTNITYNDFFRELGNLSGKKYRMIHIPLIMMRIISILMLLSAKFYGNDPLITPSLVKKFSKNWIVSSSRASEELGYRFLSIKEGLEQTLQWIKQSDNNGTG